MRRSRLDICQDQRGHRATCHSYMQDKQPYGFGMDAVEALKKGYENHRYLLTEEEMQRVDEYERKKEEAQEEKETFSEFPKPSIFDGTPARNSESGRGPTRRSREPRPSLYGNWIFGGMR